MKYVFRIAVAVALVSTLWQVLGPEISNVIFQDELKDISAQLGWRTGVAAPASEEDVRNLVIRKAERHDIILDPKQVTVERTGSGEQVVLFIAVDYTVSVDLLVYKLPLHFNPTSKGGGLWGSVESPPPPARPALQQKPKSEK